MIQVICCSSLLSVPGRPGAFSRDFTTSLAPECRAFSGASKIEKLKAPQIPGPEGAVDTNDWCISCDTYYMYGIKLTESLIQKSALSCRMTVIMVLHHIILYCRT